MIIADSKDDASKLSTFTDESGSISIREVGPNTFVVLSNSDSFSLFNKLRYAARLEGEFRFVDLGFAVATSSWRAPAGEFQ
ncbi:MAG TPA: hypothetical protein VFE31_08840 [Opitutaceae bacterium]|nr:hypothetical protein [Opitutaceae bacterium]